MSIVTLAEFDARSGLPTHAKLTNTARQECIDEASGVAEGYLRVHYSGTMSSVTLSSDVKRIVVRLATYYAMERIGFNPEKDSDRVIRQGYDDSIAWLKDVAAGKVSLLREIVGAPSGEEARPYVYSDAVRGW
jgi:phage gp36-like protein